MKRETTSVNVLTRARRWLLAGALLALLASPSHAGYVPQPAIEVAATPGATGTFVVGGGTVGWSFTANADLIVTDLGYYDLNGDGLGESHPVGIWDSVGQLLGSATVKPSDALFNGFRYTATTPFSLQLGKTYVIGAYHTEKVDNYLSSYGTNPLASYSTATEISYTGSRITFGKTFVQPGVYAPPTGEVVGRFGPNFQFTPIPEPTTALFGLALVGFCTAARRRTQAAA